jgi:hypothetical protein
MNLLITRILPALLLSALFHVNQAQDFVITAKSDTLRGTVRPINFGIEKKVTVTDNNKKKTTLSIFQTRSFSLKGEIYHPVKGDKGYVFMKLLKPGYLSLYAFQLENQTSYDGRYLYKRDGQGFEVPNLNFKKMVTRLLEDCIEVAAQIDNGTLSKRDLNKIIDLYNQCIDNRTQEQKQAITTTAISKPELTTEIPAWNILEEKIKSHADFEGKKDAQEMVADIKNKLNKNENIPNFLIEGLKNILSKTDLTAELETALKEIKP